MRKMTRFFSPFSLKAPWNCVAIRLQKPRRQLVSWSGMGRLSAGSLRCYPPRPDFSSEKPTGNGDLSYNLTVVRESAGFQRRRLR